MGTSNEIMSMDGDDPWVDSAVAERAFVTDAELAQMQLTNGFNDVLARIAAADARPAIQRRRRPISRRAATLAIAGVVLASAGAAAAAVRGGALTGLFGAPGMTENDTSEYVNIAAPNFPALAHQLGDQLHSEGLRFAPGVGRNQMVDLLVQEIQRMVMQEEQGTSAAAKATRQHGSFMDVTGVKGRIAGLAQCTWQHSWLQAYEANDAAGKNTAIEGLSALNNVITTTRSKNGTFSGTIMAETNQKNALVGNIRHMKDNDFKLIQRLTALNCPAAAT
jgi:hypothetical protein